MLLLAVLMLAGCEGSLGPGLGPSPPPSVGAPPAPARARTEIVALGRVEPVSEEIQVVAGITGRLAGVWVEEGETVEAGQVLAEVEHADFDARIVAARATVAIREAELEQLRNGALPAEREEAAARVAEAEAVLAQARHEFQRQRALLDRGLGSQQTYDDARRELSVAQARHAATRYQRAVIDRPPREDELKQAEAELRLAQAQLSEAESLRDKAYARAPISGVVLRKYRRAGELVGELSDTPIVSLGDLSRLRVRVEVDESDIAQVFVGQSAWVTAPAYPGERFSGRVLRLSGLLGRKQIRSDDPAERTDTRVLEVLVELDEGQSLPVGLRVDAYLPLADPVR